ncbi:hypothetical protein JCM1841_003280 [Sporobolomyces salmonicolor]
MAALHTVPIQCRPPLTLGDYVHSLAFNLTFGLYLVLIHAFQLLFLPFLVASHFFQVPLAGEVHRAGIAYSKETFASLLVLIVSQFGPSRLVVSAESERELNRFVRRDAHGEVVGLAVDRHAVWIANHQMYADWIYVWLVLSYARVSEGLSIVIKASLQWSPIVGPAMQLFRFIFISKTKTLAASSLFSTAQDAVRRDAPYQLLLFPEGTLYSALTRPKSKAYADALEIPDTTHLLHPRSTGLLFTLRTLSTLFPPSHGSPASSPPSVDPAPPSPHLTIIDATLGYSGVPPQSYAQSYYTLQSIFGRGISPPTVHLHLRWHALESIPIGNVRPTARPQHLEQELTQEERSRFAEWLRGVWEDKDRLMAQFGERGAFAAEEEGEGKANQKVEIELRMRTEDWARLGSVPVVLWAAWRMLRCVL